MRQSGTPGFALLALAALLAGCSGGLYTAEGLPPLNAGGGKNCDPNTQLDCPGSTACVTRDVNQCQACGTPCAPVANGQVTCSSPDELTTPRSCGHVCDAGWLSCSTGCCRTLAVAAGGDHTCAVTTDGTLRCWGANGSGQVTRTSTSAAEPFPVTVLEGAGLVLAAGFSHTCALVGGAVQCWGANGAGQSTVPALSGAVTGLAAGQAHTCAIAGGTVTCWGDSSQGKTTPHIDVAGLIAASTATRIVAGANHTCTLHVGGTASGAVRCWGDDRRLQLAGGAPFAAGSGMLSIAAGHDHTCVSDSFTEGLTCWGGNAGLVVLPGLFDPQPTPAVPLKGNGDPIVGKKAAGLLAAGRAHTCVNLPTVPPDQPEPPVCFGENGFGQLGGVTLIPPAQESVQVSGVTPDPQAVSAGTDHTCARLTDDSLKCWGRNDFGQLGNGSTTTPATPGAVYVSGR